MKTLIIGSRESRLAVVQSEEVLSYIRKYHPEIDVRLLTMKTTGDRILDRTLEEVGGKGLFVKELDAALLEGRADLTVHSLKDMTMETSTELPILGFSKREDPRDVLVLPKRGSQDPIAEKGTYRLPAGAVIGCSSRRRILQAQALFPDAVFQSVRGNVNTRLRKLDEGQVDALILAAAGLKRLGLKERISRYFSTEEILPAAGQGILAVQGKKGCDTSFLDGFFDRDSEACAIAERSFVRTLDGGCSSPIASYAVADGDNLMLRGLYVREEDGCSIKGQLAGNTRDAEETGRKLAEMLKMQVEHIRP